jgi:hypothetical protein
VQVDIAKPRFERDDLALQRLDARRQRFGEWLREVIARDPSLSERQRRSILWALG